MPRPRLLLLALFVLAACSGGGNEPAPAPTTPGTSSRNASGNPTPPAVQAPRAIVEHDRTLFVLELGRERRISTKSFYSGGSRTSEPPLSVSPNRRWVLTYTATRPGWFVIPIAGGAPIRLPGAAKLPTWSKDSTVAYVADGDLHVLTPGRRDVALLAPAPEGCCFGLAWSPDGRRIAMEGFDRTLGHEQIWVVDRSGGNLRRLWSGRAGSAQTGWALGFSPDSSRVVSTNAERPTTVGLDGTARVLEGDPALGDRGFTWWHAQILVHTRSDPARLGWEKPEGGLKVLDEPTAFATETALHPTGSPLGMTIMRREDSKTAVFVVRPDSTALRRLTGWGESISALLFSIDGRWLVYELAKSHSVRAVRTSDGTVRTLGTGRLRAVA